MTQTFKIADGDWIMNGARGQPHMVVDAPKLAQDLNEMLSIETQGNGFGAGLDSLIGLVTDAFAFRTAATRNIRSSITSMQRLQDRFLSRYRPTSERIAAVSILRVTPTTQANGTGDKVTYAFQLSVATVAGQAVTSSGVLV